MKKLSDLSKKKFIDVLINKYDAEVYAVGGVVRDSLISKENKDIDLVVRNIDKDRLIEILQNFGKADFVGDSFGVIKFTSNEDGLEYDVALPRKEVSTGEGYRDFEIIVDKNFTIEDDLKRRDFGINSIAYSLNDLEFVDPLGGIDDLKNKKISMSNPMAFSEDPLRMLRGVVFAARLGFSIDENGSEMIRKNAPKIKNISGERILEELRKVINKGGDPLYAADLLRGLGLYEHIFGTKVSQNMVSHFDLDAWNNISSFGEFIFLLLKPITNNPADLFKSRLKGDIATQKEIMALNKAYMLDDNTTPLRARITAHNMYVLFPDSLKSNILPKSVKAAANDLLSGKYLKTIKELSVDGNDLMNLGLKGKEIGDSLKLLLSATYADKIENNKQKMLDYLSNRK